MFFEDLQFGCVPNLRIISTFAYKMASVQGNSFEFWMNKPFANLSDQNFMDYGCLSGDIEDNIKLGQICR